MPINIPTFASPLPGEPNPEVQPTGIYATEVQLQRLREVFATAEEFLRLSGPGGALRVLYGSPWAADEQFMAEARRQARARVLKAIHKAALESGLPDFDGFYGIDTSGQFLRG